MSKALSIFVSYASEDAEAVESLDSWLRERGYAPWLDKRNLIAGQDWELEIKRAVRSAHIVLACISRKAVAKTGYVQTELRAALDAADERPPGKIFLIPLRIDECEIPERLQHLHRVDLFTAGGRDQLAKALEREMSRLPGDTELAHEDALPSASQTESAHQIHEFVRQARLTDVVSVSVISHTGGVTLRALIDALAQANELTGATKPILLQVLLRSRELSDLTRAQSIERSTHRLKDLAASSKMFNVEVRYYASPAFLRCIIFEHADASFSALSVFLRLAACQGTQSAWRGQPFRIHPQLYDS
jgi:hypothetical protein